MAPKDTALIISIICCFAIVNLFKRTSACSPISYLSKNKVKNNEINFSTGYEGSYSIIKCRNNILDSVLFNNPSLKTDKEDKDNHGKGITIINSIAHKYNGDVIIKERNKEFVITVILDNRSLPENLWFLPS